MTWPHNLVLIRHAESEGNVLTVDQRATTQTATYAYNLTEKGCEQARVTGEYLRAKFPSGFDIKYVSYYSRSKQTMELMLPGDKAYEDPRLAEAQRGIYHTMTHSDIEKYYPNELKRKELEGLYHYRAPGGENWPDVELRIHSFLGTLSRDAGGKNVVAVVHGHWLLLFQRLIHHFSIDEAIKKYKSHIFDNASITHYTAGASGRLSLVSENITPWKIKL